MAEIHFAMSIANAKPPSISKVTKEAMVSWKVKVVEELERFGTVKNRTDMKDKSVSVPGWNMLDDKQRRVGVAAQ